MQASDVMSTPVHVLGPDDSAAYARNAMIRHRCSRLLVVDEDRLVGIVTKKDLGYRLRQAEPAWRRRPIDRIPIRLLMTPDPISVAPDLTVGALAGIMLELGIGGLPVVDDCALVGIVTRSDLLGSTSVARLEGRVEDLMSEAALVSRYHSLDHVVEHAAQHDGRVVVVNNDGTLAGIITESNLAFYEFAGRQPGESDREPTMFRRESPGGPKTRPYVRDVSAVAEDLMSGPVETTTPGAPIAEAVGEMRALQINSLVVVEDGEIKGIITRDGVIKGVAL